MLAETSCIPVRIKPPTIGVASMITQSISFAEEDTIWREKKRVGAWEELKKSNSWAEMSVSIQLAHNNDTMGTSCTSAAFDV
jgi:hypothetical protein